MFYGKTNLTLGSLFDGIGGFPYAASFYGIRPLWASEIVSECVSVTRRHFPDMEHLGDITQVHGNDIPPVDIITFGSPCQDFSTAKGMRSGLAGARSGLFREAIRIIDEMREATHGEYPRFTIFENVPGSTNCSNGRDYQAVLAAFTKSKVPMPRSGKWANAGMVRGSGVDLAWCIYDAQHFGTAQRRRRLFLVCDFRGTRAGEILFVPKSLRGYFEAGGTPRQGLTAFAESGSGAAGGPVEFLNVQGGNIVTAMGFDLQQITSKTNRSVLGPVQPTLCKAGNPHVVSGVLCMGTAQANAAILSNQSPTLLAGCEHPLLVHPQIAGTLCASGAGLSRPAGMKSEPDFCVASAVDFRVRRLTPLEAERLMGFEDHWTQYGHDGKPISDTKRYSMLGNSIAVPCVAYIMQGIRDALLKEGGEDYALCPGPEGPDESKKQGCV